MRRDKYIQHLKLGFVGIPGASEQVWFNLVQAAQARFVGRADFDMYDARNVNGFIALSGKKNTTTQVLGFSTSRYTHVPTQSARARVVDGGSTRRPASGRCCRK